MGETITLLLYDFVKLRRLLLFTNITREGGNCKVLCTTCMLSVSSGPKQKSTNVQQSVDVFVLKKYGLDILTEALADHDYDRLILLG